MTESEAIKKAIRYFECIKNDAVVVLNSGFGTRPGESNIVYRNRKMYSELAIRALEKQIDTSDVVERLKTDSSVKLYGSGNGDNYLIPIDKAIKIVKGWLEE